MIALSTTVLAGALAEVAASATLSNAINGIVGNRTDAVFVRSIRAISAGFRSLSGNRDLDFSNQIMISVDAAFRRSFYRYIKTISTQSSNYEERIAVDCIKREFDKLAADKSVLDALSVSEAVRPILASVEHMNINSKSAALAITLNSMTSWCKQHAHPFPYAFERILTERAPNDQPSWIDAFRSELAVEIVNNTAYAQLLIVSNLSTIGEATYAIDATARALASNMQNVSQAVQVIEHKVFEIQEVQTEQLTHLRNLISLLPPVGSTSGHDTCLRVLGSCMFSNDGHPTPAGLIILNAFSEYYAIDHLDRQARLTLIRDVHTRLTESLGSDAYVSRFDAGEFDVILRNMTSIVELQRVSGQIILALLRPFEVAGSAVLLTPKIGAALSPEHGFSPDSLLRNADLALRHALAYRVDDIVIYRPELRTNADSRISLECDLRDALNKNEFRLTYQPIVRLDNNMISGFEALIRWTNPKRGDVSPADFIPVAEEMGLLPKIGAWLMRTACTHAARWPGHLRVSVNVSPIEFNSNSIVNIIEDALASSGLSPSRLELDITEGIFLGDPSVYNPILEGIRRMHVRMSLDDFGTGYSSLGYLRQAPLNSIKIDQSFSRGIGRNSANGAIAAAILGLSKSMGLEVIAEGVESEDDLAALQKLGCTYAQGYLFGRPLTPSETLIVAKRGAVERSTPCSKPTE